jgi:hypothetical protein
MQGRSHSGAQAQPTIGLPQQQHATVTGDIAALESGFNPAAFTGWKVKRLLGTFCHGQSLVRFQSKHLNFIELHGLCPSYSRNIRVGEVRTVWANYHNRLESPSTLGGDKSWEFTIITLPVFAGYLGTKAN